MIKSINFAFWAVCATHKVPCPLHLLRLTLHTLRGIVRVVLARASNAPIAFYANYDQVCDKRHKVKIKTRPRLKIVHLVAQSHPISNYWHTINDWRTLQRTPCTWPPSNILLRLKMPTNFRFKCQTITHRCVRNGFQLNWNHTTELKTVTSGWMDGWMIITIIELLFISFGPSNYVCFFALS